MKQEINPTYFAKVVSALIASDCKTAIQYIDAKTVVKATWHNKPSGRNRSESLVLSFGAPGFREAAFIKSCIKAGEPFPVKKIQLRAYPKKRITK